MSARPLSPNMVEARPSADGFDSENGGSSQHETFAPAQVIDDALGLRDGNGAFIVERSKSAKRRTQGRKGSVTNSNGSFRRGAMEAGNSAFGNSRRVTNAHCSEERGIPSSQGQQKNGIHKIDAEGTTKRVDGWSGSPSCSSNNRLEVLQPCACGTSHASSRSKAGHRGFGRTVIGESNASSRSTGVGGPTKTGNLDPVLTWKSTESQGRSVPAITLEQRRVGSTTDRPSKASHSKSSSLDLSSGTSSGYHGGPRSSPNGSTTGHENGFSVPVAVKPMWTPRAISTSGGPNGIPGKVLAAGGRPLDSEHGKSDSVRRPASSWILASKPTSPKSISVTAVESPQSTKEEPTVSEFSSPAEEGEMLDPNAPLPFQTTTITTDGGQGNAETEPNAGSSSPMISAPDSSSEDLSLQAAAINAQGFTVSEDRTSTELQPGVSGEEQESPQVVTQGAVNMVPVADFTSQVLHSSPSPGTMPGLPPPHLHANGHFPQGAFLRPPSNGMYAFATDMLPSQGPLQHAPNMSPMNMHHPRPFGFFPVGPWAVRGSTGVLPLPQAGGYAGVLSMGVLPPMSLAVPGTVSPGGLGPGHLPAIPDGLNSLQLGEHQRSLTHQVFMSRFGASPGRGGSHNRVMVGRTPGLASDGVQGPVVAADFNEGQMPLGQAVSNGSQSPLPGLNERRQHADSPTSADFSFFHSKWPISGGDDASLKVSESESNNSSGKLPTSAAAERTQCIGGSDGATKSSLLPAGEYSLFASAPSKGFGFF